MAHHRRTLVVAGLMSGTSGDGVDIAVLHIAPRAGSAAVQLLAHRAFPFSAALRRAVLAAQDAPRISTAGLARLHWRLGLAYAETMRTMRATLKTPLDLVGCHGQTIYHQGRPEGFLGRSFSCTWQIGEMAPLAEAAGAPVVSNFRPADMVAGGQGAPLVPLLDMLLYRHRIRTRILLNLGGIANLTRVPPLQNHAPCIAFDTGPANMVIDALMQKLFDKPFDRGGRTAARGQVLQPVVDALLRDPFFCRQPPRSAGREQFGPRFAAALLASCRRHSKLPEDAIATATALTAQSISQAIRHFAAVPDTHCELIAAGGGARNATLLAMLEEALRPEGVIVMAASDPSLPVPLPLEAKEAAAFAVLAWMSWHKQPGNVPTATGARGPVVLGQVTCG